MKLLTLIKDNEHGGIVFWMCMLPFLISSLALIIYGGNAYATKAICRSKLENALLNAAVLSQPTASFIDSGVARPFFELYLQKNLNLNSDFTPKSNSIASGKVTYSNYRAINTTVPINDDFIGDTVNKPSLEAQISVPVMGGYTINVVSRVSATP